VAVPSVEIGLDGSRLSRIFTSLLGTSSGAADPGAAWASVT